MPIVSIVTPCYNSESQISATIQSVQQQTFQDYEHIIVDDYSTDRTVDVVNYYAKYDHRIKLVKLASNSGAAVARNNAIQLASGRYIAFLDSDDAWFPSKLESQIDFMKNNNAAFVFSSYQKVDEFGNVLGVVSAPNKVDYYQLLKCCVIGCLTAMYDTQKLGKIEMPLIRKRQDFGLWLRILKKTKYAYGQNEVLARYSVRKGSISSNKKSAAVFQWKVYREVERLPLFSAFYYFSHYAVRGVVRQKIPQLTK